MADDSSTRSWDAAADAWVEHADTSDYQSLFLQPRMLALAGDVAGRRVLALGCGEGSYARRRARRSFVGALCSDRVAWPARSPATFRTPTLRRHRPLEDYVGGAIAAGFVLRELQEPMATADDLRASPRFEHMTRIPYFMFMR